MCPSFDAIIPDASLVCGNRFVARIGRRPNGPYPVCEPYGSPGELAISNLSLFSVLEAGAGTFFSVSKIFF